MNKDIAPVLDEIRTVLKKHHMAGLVVVANATHVDFSMDLDAPWNCIRIEHDAGGRALVRVRSKASEYPSREAQHKTLEVTVGTFVTLNDTIGRIQSGLHSILVTLAQHVEFIGRSRTEE